MHWYCPPCEGKAIKNIKIEQEIEERCKAYFKQYEQRLENLEQKMANKPDREEMTKLMENKADLDQVKATPTNKSRI